MFICLFSSNFCYYYEELFSGVFNCFHYAALNGRNIMNEDRKGIGVPVVNTCLERLRKWRHTSDRTAGLQAESRTRVLKRPSGIAVSLHSDIRYHKLYFKYVCICLAYVTPVHQLPQFDSRGLVNYRRFPGRIDENFSQKSSSPVWDSNPDLTNEKKKNNRRMKPKHYTTMFGSVSTVYFT
jgi:hypothetical protein